MTVLRWAIGHSHEAKAHRLAWPTRTDALDAKTTPSLCGSNFPLGWAAFFEGQPDAAVFPACRVCLNRASRRRSAQAPRVGALRAPAGLPRQEELCRLGQAGPQGGSQLA